MAISLRAAGSWAAVNATTQTVTLPTHAAGDMLLVRFAVKPYTATPTCSAGWTAVATFGADGTDANGDGVGSVLVGAFWKIATSAAESNPVITWGTTAAPGCAVALSYQKAADDKDWGIPRGGFGGDTTADTSKSMTVTGNGELWCRPGDMIDFFMGIRDDTTMTSPSITISGATLGAVSEQPAAALSSTTSNDISADGGYRLCSVEGSSNEWTVTGTLSTSETGTAWLTILRIVGIVEVAGVPGATSGDTVDVDAQVMFGTVSVSRNAADFTLRMDAGWSSSAAQPADLVRIDIGGWRHWEGNVTQQTISTHDLEGERYLAIIAANEDAPDATADSGVDLVLGDYRKHKRMHRPGDIFTADFETWTPGLWPGLTFDAEMDIDGLSDLTAEVVLETRATWPTGANGPILYEITYGQGDTIPEIIDLDFQEAGVIPDSDIMGVVFGEDANLYRPSAGVLQTDGRFVAATLGTAWTAYTPSLTGSGSNPTLGSSTLTGRYKLLDDNTLAFACHLAITTGGAWNPGSGVWSFSIPAGMTGASREQVVAAEVHDSGTRRWAGVAHLASGGTTVFVAYGVESEAVGGTGVVQHNTPATWATGDNIMIAGIVEIA